MPQLFANNAYGSLASSINGAATTIVLSSGNGARFPAPTGGDFFYATLIGLDGNGNEAAWEIVQCTARATDQLTVVRAQEGTTATSWNAGTRIELRLTKAGMDGKQPLDGDLTAIAALAGTSGLLKKTAANTWSLDTTTYQTAQSVTGIVKSSGTTLSAAVAGTDYLAPAAIGTTVQAYDADLTAWAGKTAPTGAAVGTTDTQTLTNKTVVDPIVTLGAGQGTAGQVPVSQGAGLPPVWGDVSGGANIQEFSTSGTWTKPSGASFVLVELWGGGGGGGGGARGNSATGGSGGGGGGSIVRFYKASDLPSSVTVTIGAGGSGGASVTTNSAGNDGSSGGQTSFGVVAYADFGAGGRGGNASVTDTATVGGGGYPAGSSSNNASGWGEGGPYAPGNVVHSAESGGGNGGLGRSTAAGGPGGSSSKGGPGGGGGGGVSSATTYGGGDGGAIREGNGTTLLVGGNGGTAPGEAGASGNSNGSSIYRVAGSGGAGGAGSLTTAAGVGGNGGRAAGGGGGGGASGFPSGAGGAGGNGYARITAW